MKKQNKMTMFQQLFFCLVVFFGCFGGSYLFFMDWQFQHVVCWYFFCLILILVILFKKGSDE